MKKIYKIRDKYFYDGKVQLAMPRMKENLLISKNGIEYVEVSDNYNLIKSSSYHAPKGSSFPLSKSPITNDYYLALLELNSPVIRIFSTEKIKTSVNNAFKESTIDYRLAFKPYVENFGIYIEGVFVNDEEPIIGEQGDIIGITRDIDSISSSEEFVSIEDKNTINQLIDNLFDNQDECYIISKCDGILSIRQNFISQKFGSIENIKRIILEKIYSDSGFDPIYFIKTSNEKDMTIEAISKSKSNYISYHKSDPNNVFLSKETMEIPFLNGNKYHESRIGSWDLMTFDNTELKYNGDINEKPKSFIKRLFKRK